MNQLISIILQTLQDNVYFSFFCILLAILLTIYLLKLIGEGRSFGILGAKPQPNPPPATTSSLSTASDKIDKIEVSPRLPPINVPVLKRVCMISSEYPPRIYGGLGVHVDNLSKAISSHVDIDIILPCNKNTDDGCSYYPRTKRIHPEPMAKTEASYDNPISWLFFAQHVPEKIKNLNTLPDIVHCHDWVTILGGIKCRWQYKIPLVYNVHLPNISPFHASIENLGLMCSDLVIVNSNAMNEEIIDRGYNIKNIKTIQNGVDSDIFRPSERWPDDDSYILFVGRLVEQKGVDYLLRAFLFVKERFPAIKLKIVGEGACEPLLKRLSENLDLAMPDQVDFLGWKRGADLVKLYQSARVVVVPSIYEPFGMTALEAMSCKRPVVVSDTGGLHDIVVHKETGYRAAPKSYLDLAQWIMALLADEDRRNLIAKMARDRAESEIYSWNSIASRVIDQYRILLNEKEKMSFSVTDEIKKIISQIKKLAEEMEPTLKNPENKILKEVFDWAGEE